MGRASLPRRASGLIALVIGVSAPNLAAASLPTISWDAPEGCPTAAALTDELARHVDPAALAAEPANILVHARPTHPGWRVVVTIEAGGDTQERALAVESCEAAARAAAFVIAIAVDPARREPEDLVPAPPEHPEPEPPEAPPETPAPAEEPQERGPATPPADDNFADDPVDIAPPRPRPRRVVRGLVQLGPALQVGMLPVEAGLRAAAGLGWPRARLTAGYTRWFEVEVRRAGDRPYGADFSVHAGHLRGGPVLRAGPLELPLHVGLELGALAARGLGGDINYRATALWAAATLGAGLAWAPRALRGHAAVVALAEAAISLRRPRFKFAGDLEVHRIGPAAFRGFLLVEARFP